jgi:hypothetical protein
MIARIVVLFGSEIMQLLRFIEAVLMYNDVHTHTKFTLLAHFIAELIFTGVGGIAGTNLVRLYVYGIWSSPHGASVVA